MAFQAARSLWRLLAGGMMVVLPVDPNRPDGPALIRTVVQFDGDILDCVSPALLAKPADAMAADFARHHDAVVAAMKPLGKLKIWVERLGVGIAAAGAGTALASTAGTITGSAQIAEAAPVFGLGTLITAIGFVLPMVSGWLLRRVVAVALRIAGSRLGRRLTG